MSIFSFAGHVASVAAVPLCPGHARAAEGGVDPRIATVCPWCFLYRTAGGFGLRTVVSLTLF